MSVDVLAQIVADLNRLEQLSEEQLAEVLSAQVWLEAQVWVRLTRLAVEGSDRDDDSQEPERDQMLNVDEAAEILSVSPRWLYDHSKDLPFARKLAPRTLRFSEQGMYRWLKARP